MKKMLIILPVLLVATSSLAIVFPESDRMGLYFDPFADVFCVEGATPYSQHLLYLMLTNPTFDALYGFEAGITIVGDALVLETTFFNPEALNVGDNTNMIVGFGSPTVTSSITPLATMTLLYTSVIFAPVSIDLLGSEPSSLDPLYPVVLLADSELRSLETSLGASPEGAINVFCWAPVEASTLDHIKALYR